MSSYEAVLVFTLAIVLNSNATTRSGQQNTPAVTTEVNRRGPLSSNIKILATRIRKGLESSSQVYSDLQNIDSKALGMTTTVYDDGSVSKEISKIRLMRATDAVSVSSASTSRFSADPVFETGVTQGPVSKRRFWRRIPKKRHLREISTTSYEGPETDSPKGFVTYTMLRVRQTQSYFPRSTSTPHRSTPALRTVCMSTTKRPDSEDTERGPLCDTPVEDEEMTMDSDEIPDAMYGNDEMKDNDEERAMLRVKRSVLLIIIIFAFALTACKIIMCQMRCLSPDDAEISLRLPNCRCRAQFKFSLPRTI